MRKKTSTTRLPQTLRDQLQESPGSEHAPPRRSRKLQLSRKEVRKQERSGRKQRKADFFAMMPTRVKRRSEDAHVDSPQRKKFKAERSEDELQQAIKMAPKLTEFPSDTRDVTSKFLKVKAPRNALPDQVASKRTSGPAVKKISAQSQKEVEEDRYIKYLESKLGYKSSRRGARDFEEDGLDDLFDLTSTLPSSKNQGSPSSSEVNTIDEDSTEGSSQEEEEWHGVINDVVESAAPSEPTEPVPIPGTRYVPPQLRKRNEAAQESEELLKLKRQLKGLLNRMSEQNMATILTSVEDIFRTHRRNDVTTTLTNLIIDGIASHSSLLDSYVVMYAAFIGSLYRLIGLEFAAFFVQSVVSQYEHHYEVQKEVPDMPTDGDALGKECANLIVLLSELYNFQVISSLLVFDLVRGLLAEDLLEFKVELLLKILRNSGQQLRQDDPSALKDIIQIVQSKVSTAGSTLSSRTRFLVETLINLKNNKIKRNITLNQGGEAVERMKKFLSGLSKKHQVHTQEPLRVSLEDLHLAETKGKWWLVGSAWGGDPLLERQEQKKQSDRTDAEDADTSLGKLARKQGMNTDVRRSIFVVLMSSEDYVDACDRLSQLNLSDIQQREIVRVLLHCCGNEKSYNPYYTLVCQHLCRTHHGYKITLQYCLWDFIRGLGEINVGGAEVIKNLKDGGGFDVKSISTTRLKNVAKAYGWWIAKDCTTLAILKPVDFTTLREQSKEFISELFTQLLISTQSSSPIIAGDLSGDLSGVRKPEAIQEVFVKAARIQPLAAGIQYFLSTEFGQRTKDNGTKELITWAIDIGKEALQSDIGPGE